MFSRIYPLLEDGTSPRRESVDTAGLSLAKVIEIHPDLEPLLDFYGADPIEMAYEIGMVHPREEDPEDDLAEIDFGPGEWHEAAGGVAAVRQAIDALRADPASVGRYLYDPNLGQDDVIRDLESMLTVLEAARDRETRFRLVGEGQSGMWPRPRS